MQHPLSCIVRTICNAFAWFVVVFGVYIIVHGHLTPGGGFQGGAVVATFMALLLVSHGATKCLGWVRTRFFYLMEHEGLLTFIAAGFLGIGVTFFYNVLALRGGLFGSAVALGPNSGALNTAGTIALMNCAVGIEVVGGLSMILLYMVQGVLHVDKPTLRGKEEAGHDR